MLVMVESQISTSTLASGAAVVESLTVPTSWPPSRGDGLRPGPAAGGVQLAGAMACTGPGRARSDAHRGATAGGIRD